MDRTFSAPAKIILLGEHAVVYGKPSLAVPLSTLRAYALSYPLSQGSGLKITAVDLDNQELSVNSSMSDHPLVAAALLFLGYLKCSPPDANILLRSDIPIASGMGSGAAITTALFRALSNELDKLLPDETLNDLVFQVEKLYHGTPSGVDNTVIVFEQPIYFRRDTPIERLKIAQPLTLIVADTGVGASTKLAVADVRKLYDSNRASTVEILESISKLVKIGKTAVESGDFVTLGSVMSENHRLLQQLTVSSPMLDKFVGVAEEAGAFGAKLSGGGRGGNMIALVSDVNVELVKSRLLEAGAIQVYQTIVK